MVSRLSARLRWFHLSLVWLIGVVILLAISFLALRQKGQLFMLLPYSLNPRAIVGIEHALWGESHLLAISITAIPLLTFVLIGAGIAMAISRMRDGTLSKKLSPTPGP